MSIVSGLFSVQFPNMTAFQAAMLGRDEDGYASRPEAAAARSADSQAQAALASTQAPGAGNVQAFVPLGQGMQPDILRAAQQTQTTEQSEKHQENGVLTRRQARVAYLTASQESVSATHAPSSWTV